MFELLEVCRNCKQEPEAFRQRIRVFRLPDAAIYTPLELPVAPLTGKSSSRNWTPLAGEHGADLLGETDFKRYKLMQDFSHRVGDMLALIADTLNPQDFQQSVDYGFAGDAAQGA